MNKVSGSHRTPDSRAVRKRSIARSAIQTFVFIVMLGIWPVFVHSADPADVEIFQTTGSCPGCDLSGAFLDAVKAEGGDNWNVNLRDASLYRVNLNLSNLSGADLSGTNLRLSSLKGADLSYASLYGADLTDASLVGANTTGVRTDEFTTCPDSSAGPCAFEENN